MESSVHEGWRRGLLGVAVGIWLLVALVLPLAAAIELAEGSELSRGEWTAIAAAWRQGLAACVIAATLATSIAVLLARVVHPLALLTLLLISRASDAQGVLAWGLAPGGPAAVLSLVVNLAPLAALVVLLRMQTRPVELLEAAADLGAGVWTRARTIAWPHLRPAVGVAFVWALLEGLGDTLAFELAGGGKAYAPGLLLRDAMLHEFAPARALAVLLGLLLVALPCAWLLAGELRLADGASWRPQPRASLRLRVLAWSMFVLLASVPARLLFGDQPQGFGASDMLLARLLLRTLGLALGIAMIAAVLGSLLALLSRGLSGVSSRLSATLLVLPIAIPASVYGLLALAVGVELGLRPGVSLTTLALLPSSLALAFLVARVFGSVVPTRLLDAAADLGADPLARLRMVWLPLGRPALAAAAAIVFAWVLGQATIPAFTSGPGGDTLAVGLTVMARGGSLALVRRWALVSVLVPVLAVVLLSVVGRMQARWSA
jgi:ABC-type spermidine/putrescine transport system permease subunit II